MSLFNLKGKDFGKDLDRLAPGDYVLLDRNVVCRLTYVDTATKKPDGRYTWHDPDRIQL